MWGWRWLEELGQDLQFAARTLRRSPGFTATVVVTLALATGATTSIFSVVNSVLLRPLPFANPDRLVQISGRLWQQRFNRDPSLVGQKVTLDGRPYTVIGVMPESFQFPYNAASLMDGALPESRTDVGAVPAIAGASE